ncbi:extracellular solute-binding protein [Streptomyces sp. L7]
MKLAPRFAVLLATAAVVAGCAPQTSDNSSSDKDETSGTLRVWLFQEVGNDPKAKVVDSVVTAFEKAHKGTKVDVEYIPIDTRAQRVKAAFNDPKSAPDVMEYGNTDTAGYVHDGGLLDVTKEFGSWSEAKDTDPTAKQSVTVDGKQYGSPFYVGVRALYYRTDVFKDLGLQPPRPWPSWRRPPARSTRRSPTSTAWSSAVPTPTARCPSYGPTAANSPPPRAVRTPRGSTAPPPRRSIKAYTRSSPATTVPPPSARSWAATTRSPRSRGRQGGHGDRRRLQPQRGRGRQGQGQVRGRPAAGCRVRLGRPRVRRRQQHRCPEEHFAPHARGRPHGTAHLKKATQASMFDAMGFLPTFTDVRDAAAAKVPFEKPFVQTLAAGTKFVPASPGWSEIDSSLVLPTMLQEVISGKKSVAAASKDAAKKMNSAFSSAGWSGCVRERPGPLGSISLPLSSSSAVCSSTPSTSSA